MAYICYKKCGCKNCKHYRYDEEENRMCCWVKQDEAEEIKKDVDLSLVLEPDLRQAAADLILKKYELDEPIAGRIIKIVPKFGLDSVVTAAGETFIINFCIIALVENQNGSIDMITTYGSVSKEVTGAGNGVLVNNKTAVNHYRKANLTQLEINTILKEEK